MNVDASPGLRTWVTRFAGSFAWRSVLLLCAIVAVVFAAAAVIEGGSNTPDEPGVVGWLFLLIIYFVWLSGVGMIVATAIALALAHLLISIPVVASTLQSFLTAFAGTVAVLAVASVYFAYRPGPALVLCIIFAAGNCVIAFHVARSLPRFPASDAGFRDSLA